MPTPTGRLEHASGAWFEIGIIRVPYGFRRQMRMKVNRHIQCFRLRQYAVVAWMIEESSLGRPVDQRAMKAQFLHRPSQFPGGGVRAEHRQHGEPGEPVRVT